MCESQGCCHGSSGLGLGSVPADVASGSAKTVGTLVAAKLAAGAVLLVLAAAAAVVRTVLPLAVLAVYAAAAVLCLTGRWAMRKYPHRPLYRPGLAVVPRRAIEAPRRLAIDSRHVIPAWQDYETTEARR